MARGAGKMEEDEDILNEKPVPEDREKRLFKCRHGLALTWKQCRRLVEGEIPGKVARLIRMKKGCLYTAVLSDEELKVAFVLGKRMNREGVGEGERG